ncbi:hypothetical protein AZ78_4528 [Lysobacter capsici AZ78]|uniref:Uncharacterized protein n=1 Tax=Lysobacter capsici AZ78 TaxID=1444315 RepID=A0A120AI02_9GAMM|nr:hypothetical protein AZ78_4528 [Lysobacter capsici AZ78]
MGVACSGDSRWPGPRALIRPFGPPSPASGRRKQSRRIHEPLSRLLEKETKPPHT